MVEVHADVLKGSSLVDRNRGIGVFPEPGEHVRLDVVLDKINRSFFEFQRADDSVRDDFKDKTGDSGGSFPVGRVRF